MAVGEVHGSTSCSPRRSAAAASPILGRSTSCTNGAYLPDVAAALPRLAAIRQTLSPLASFGFPGHAVTGREFTSAIAAAMRSKLQVDRMSWWLIHVLRPIVPLCRELSEIAYLWNEPHRIDGGKLKAAIGDIPRTPLDVAVACALEDLGAIA